MRYLAPSSCVSSKEKRNLSESLMRDDRWWKIQNWDFVPVSSPTNLRTQAIVAAIPHGGYRAERRERHPSHVLCPGSLSWGPIGTEQAGNEEFPRVSAGSPAAERGWASQLLGVPPRPYSAEMTTPSTLTPYPKGWRPFPCPAAYYGAFLSLRKNMSLFSARGDIYTGK